MGDLEKGLGGTEARALPYFVKKKKNSERRKAGSTIKKKTRSRLAQGLQGF